MTESERRVMPKKILLADDSITIQKVVELTFSDGDYEVIAVNNGAKAIQKLSEMRPDIILSDIIMPEKNGYEVCEYVKSHPDFRNIPVVLLTGTFEPFDPDRADKAGCDAVVTKPFESQSLIHKVEELVSQSRTAAAAPPAPSAPEPAAASPWADEEPAAPAFEPPPAEESHAEFSTSGFTPHGSDIFSAAPSEPAPPADMPFDISEPEAFSGETRAFPRMSMEEMQRMAAETAPPPAAPAPIPPSAAPEEPPQIESSPWDEPAAAEPSAPAFGGETRAFSSMSFDEPPAAAPAPPQEASPWDEPAPAFGGETRAFPSMSFEDLQKMASQAPQPEPPAPEPPAPSPEPSMWSEPAASPFGDEPPAAAFSGETKAFPRMSFEELQQMASQAAPSPEPPAESPFMEPQSSFGDDTSSFSRSASPFGEPAPEPEPEPQPEPEPAAPAAAAAEEPAPSMAASASIGDLTVGDLTEDQIDRIARRVVQLLSADVVKNIAWEVIPDMAEMVVKERIRQLEAE
jgi:CheY-like chemotaxis protein